MKIHLAGEFPSNFMDMYALCTLLPLSKEEAVNFLVRYYCNGGVLKK